MDSWKKRIITLSKSKLEEAVIENDFKSIKFVLENLDENFNLSAKELLNTVFESLAISISDASFLTNENKTLILGLVKKVFDNAT